MAAPGGSKVYGSEGDAGRLVLRVALGVLILFHGVAKITGGIGFVTGALTKAGMPADLGYLVYIGEVLAPALASGLVQESWITEVRRGALDPDPSDVAFVTTLVAAQSVID